MTNFKLEIILLSVGIKINTVSFCLISYPATQQQYLLICVYPLYDKVKVAPKTFLFETKANFLKGASVSVKMAWSALGKHHFL